MRRKLILLSFLLSLISAGGFFQSCGSDEPDGGEVVNPSEPGKDDNDDDKVGPPEGKEVFIPQELRTMNLKDSNSKWYWGRTKSTDDVILFWAKGFGNDLSKAPALQGENMTVNADRLLKKVQEFYDYYYKELKFVTPGKSNADKYRMMVMLDYSLEGTAYGGTYDNKIGALWVTPNRVQDESMNAVAHELGHSFQLQIIADGEGDAWGGCGFYEMTSQWMLWRVNPQWTTEERYHLTYPGTDQCFAAQTHKAFLHIENIYRSPYVIECWADIHGLPFIAELYRNGKVGEDPVETYKRLAKLEQEAFNDEMWHNYARLTTWDFDRVRGYTKGLSDLWQTSLTDAGDGWKRVAKNNCPQNYGFNAIPMTVPQAGETLTVQFRGETGVSGYKNINPEFAGWRYGFVATDADGKAVYGDMHSEKDGKATFTCPEGKKIAKLWLVVMGAPTTHVKHNEQAPNDAEWPYSYKFIKNSNL